jgi:intracellular sulfur oxidation DsrE/DsrF family protein
MNRRLTTRRTGMVWTGCMALALSLTALGATAAQAQGPAVPGYPAAQDVPGAKDLPNPATTYKVVFDISAAAPTPDKVNPGLVGVARFVNTLAQYGVPQDHRKIAIVIHQGATPIILNDQAFAAKFNGAHNPNIELIQNLTKAGVVFHVCGQAVVGSHIDPKTIQPEIELDLWALTTMVNLETEGYVHFSE